MATLAEPLVNGYVAPEQAKVCGKRIAELDGVRGLAILFVLCVHFSRVIHRGSWMEYGALKAATALWCGVTLFFVLSGFLITGSLIDTKETRCYFRFFYARRFLRIFPLYFGFLAICIAVFGATGNRISMADLSCYVLYLYNWSAALNYGPEAMGHLWSLAVEEQFYLLWPLVVFLFSSRVLPRVLISLMLASFLSRIAFVAGGIPRFAYFATVSHFESLCLGALAAVLVRSKTADYLSYVSSRLFFAGGCLLAVVLLLGKGMEPNKGIVLTAGMTAVCFLFFSLIVRSYNSSGQDLWPVKAMRQGWLRWLGKYSYGIYVFHMPISIWSVHKFLGGIQQQRLANRLVLELLVITGGVLSSCIIAFVSYELFEKKFLRLKPNYT